MKEISYRPESREKLVDTGMRAFSGVAGGVGLMILRSISGFGGLSIPGLVVGGAISLFGLGTAGHSPHRADKVGGLLTAAGGLVTVAASLPLIGAPVSVMMWLGSLGLIGYGVAGAAQFFRGLQSRK